MIFICSYLNSHNSLIKFRYRVGIFLPKTDKPDDPRYFLVRPGAYDPSEFSIQEIMKISTMMNDAMMMYDDNYVIAGQIGILDFTGVTLQHFVQFGPTFIKKVTMLQQDAAPIRQKGSHFVKMPQIALTVFNIFKSFTNEKNKARVSTKFFREFQVSYFEIFL